MWQLWLYVPLHVLLLYRWTWWSQDLSSEPSRFHQIRLQLQPVLFSGLQPARHLQMVPRPATSGELRSRPDSGDGPNTRICEESRKIHLWGQQRQNQTRRPLCCRDLRCDGWVTALRIPLAHQTAGVFVGRCLIVNFWLLHRLFKLSRSSFVLKEKFLISWTIKPIELILLTFSHQFVRCWVSFSGCQTLTLRLPLAAN